MLSGMGMMNKKAIVAVGRTYLEDTVMLCETSGSHDGEYEDDSLLGYTAV
jgi:hypothetical protein